MKFQYILLSFFSLFCGLCLTAKVEKKKIEVKKMVPINSAIKNSKDARVKCQKVCGEKKNVATGEWACKYSIWSGEKCSCECEQE